MGSPAAALQPDHEPVPPPPDPLAIRACLTPDVAAEFDAEWDIVLDKVKQSKDLAPVHALLHKWRHFAYSEMKDPGCYFRLLATAARTLATGEAPPGSVLGEEVKDLIRRRLGRQVYRVVTYDEALEQIVALPDEALNGYAEVLSVLELAPWSGEPHHEGNPDGAVRRWLFGPGGAGQVVYLILEDQRRVDVLLVQWVG